MTGAVLCPGKIFFGLRLAQPLARGFRRRRLASRSINCKNPRCVNFGVSPKPEAKGRSAAVRAPDVGPGDYTVVAAGKNLP